MVDALTLPAAISTLPVAVRDFYLEAVAKARDGLSLEEFSQILHSFQMLAAQGAASMAVSGPTKKAAVVAWSLMLYDALVSHVQLPIWLYPFTPLLRKLFAMVVAGAVESSYQWAVKRAK